MKVITGLGLYDIINGMPFTKGHKTNVGRKHSLATIHKMKTAENSGQFKKGSSGFIGSHTEESKKKMSHTWFKKGQEPWNKGIHYKRDEEHWNWQGGISSVNKPERHKAMLRFEYKEWRRNVFERDQYTCQECGIRGGELHADHIKQWAKYPELRYEITNGRTLCVECHKKTDTYGNKK